MFQPNASCKSVHTISSLASVSVKQVSYSIMGLYRNENSVSYFLDPPAKHFPLVNCCQPAAMLTDDKVVENILLLFSHHTAQAESQQRI